MIENEDEPQMQPEILNDLETEQTIEQHDDPIVDDSPELAQTSDDRVSKKYFV